ncbi:MAG TPA: TetR family transcriptional regulator [Solirubrobacteraceae bacterium]|jgi:AcrR family transcriptional regulator|nr:TetR family transcriptional regulator [Solirubrobacteraceae bacterium]
MTRWEPNARGRLELAAMELYGERGFERTTVAEIAERAGLTERTFFRHYADKREVLFAGSGEVPQLLEAAIAGAPRRATPMAAAQRAVETVGEAIAEQRGRVFARRRRDIIVANPELQERELIKLASWAATIAAALRERGVGEAAARLSGEVAIAVFRVAFATWVDGPADGELPELTRAAFAELRSLSRPGTGRTGTSPAAAGGARATRRGKRPAAAP